MSKEKNIIEKIFEKEMMERIDFIIKIIVLLSAIIAVLMRYDYLYKINQKFKILQEELVLPSLIKSFYNFIEVLSIITIVLLYIIVKSKKIFRNKNTKTRKEITIMLTWLGRIVFTALSVDFIKNFLFELSLEYKKAYEIYIYFYGTGRIIFNLCLIGLIGLFYSKIIFIIEKEEKIVKKNQNKSNEKIKFLKFFSSWIMIIITIIFPIYSKLFNEAYNIKSFKICYINNEPKAILPFLTKKGDFLVVNCEIQNNKNWTNLQEIILYTKKNYYYEDIKYKIKDGAVIENFVRVGVDEFKK